MAVYVGFSLLFVAESYASVWTLCLRQCSFSLLVLLIARRLSGCCEQRASG